MAKRTIRLEGMRELTAKIEEVRKSLDPDQVEPILLEGAKVIADRVKEKAPVGPTGNLKRSVVARQLNRLGEGPAPAVAAIDRKIAPHAHFVEYGTKRSPAHPFFRPAVDETEGVAARQVMRKIDELLKEAVK